MQTNTSSAKLETLKQQNIVQQPTTPDDSLEITAQNTLNKKYRTKFQSLFKKRFVNYQVI